MLDVLRAAAAAAGAEERCGTAVEAVEPARRAGSPLTLRLADGRLERADAVIVAAGGSVARTLMPEGVPFCDPEPTLGPLATDTRLVRQLDNIRVRGALELWRGGARAAREEGDGAAAWTTSAWAGRWSCAATTRFGPASRAR